MKSARVKKIKHDASFAKKIGQLEKKFVDAMDDDLNTPLALAIFHQLAKEINKYMEKNSNRDILKKSLETFNKFSDVLGLKFETEKTELTKEVEDLIKQREQARKANDWQTADEIRSKLKDMGILIEDTDKGVRWKKIKK
jgi:cysteinyl-tRNA synthetase